MDQTNVSSVFAAHLDQGLFGRSDRGVSGFPRHRALGEELRPEAFHRKSVVVPDDGFGPLAGGVLALPGEQARPAPTRCLTVNAAGAAAPACGN
ncbi:hypothetical protein P3T27_002392 [Kitasatospora sp. MAA19]|nr:hypothetical protein [Kitasatospora sp. MAA19]